MSRDTASEVKFEIGHVLFIDIVGYSKLLNEEQKERLNQLTDIVLATTPVREATDEQLVRLPTGDGMALVFHHSAEEPARCALEIAEALQKHPELPVRMGIHSGPVNKVTDVSGRTNLAGAGINMAQRVMDCGDAGHILLSQHVADDLINSRQWASRLRDLGECEVKHGVHLHLVNLYAEPLGNAGVPKRIQQAKPIRTQSSKIGWIAALIIVALLAAGALYYFTSHRPATKNAAISENSIAVLPFVNMSDDKANEYFSDGISEELLNLLAKIPQLQVTARTSSFAFKGKETGIPEIARALKVAHVLEGSVRKAGNSVRITAQLIKAGTDTHLWSETYDRKMDDIFKIQDEIAGEVVKELKVKLLGMAPKVRTTDPKAYALYLQARELGRQNNPEAYAKSDALYQQVLEIDPHYAPAWGGLSANFINKANNGLLPNQEGYARAREAAEKALAIDPDYALGHTRLGLIAMDGDNDLAGAARHYQRALALDPTDLNVLSNAATFLKELGRLDEALALEEAIVRRDPVDVFSLINVGSSQRRGGRYDAAIASLRTVLSLSPNTGGAHAQLGTVLMLKGDATAALAEIEQEKIEAFPMIDLPMAYCALGRKADADAALNALIAKYEKDGPYNIAYVYAFCGDADKAFEWLDKAVTYQDPGVSDVVTENLFDIIHSDPRWLPFLRKIGKAPDQLAKIELKMPPLPQ
jgi:adenylate cyclase